MSTSTSSTHSLALQRSRLVTPASGNCPLLLDFLCTRFVHITRQQWQERMDAGLVQTEEGRALPPQSPFPPGLPIYYYRTVAQEPQIQAQEQIIFENEAILIADKPHYLPVTPSGGYVRQTLLARLQERTGLPQLSPAHRLDRDTAGLILFTKAPRWRAIYQNLFRDRQVKKTYLAIAKDLPNHFNNVEETIEVSSFLSRDSSHFMRMQDSPATLLQAANAQTHIALLARRGARALYQLSPLTGQRHQLRVHMASLGAPIENDGIYPILLPQDLDPQKRPALQLLAWRLGFTDPVSGEPMAWQSQLQLQWQD